MLEEFQIYCFLTQPYAEVVGSTGFVLVVDHSSQATGVVVGSTAFVVVELQSSQEPPQVVSDGPHEVTVTTEAPAEARPTRPAATAYERILMVDLGIGEVVCF